MKHTVIISLIILLVSMSGFAQGTSSDAPIRVTFLHVNDVYQFTPVDGGKRGGLARVLTLKDRIKAENPNTIFTLGG